MTEPTTEQETRDALVRHLLLGGAVWLVLFGIWPVAHPEHFDGSPMAMVDLLLHCIGLIYLVLAGLNRYAKEAA